MMQQSSRHTLSARERMKSRTATIRLFSEGKRLSHYPVQVVYLPLTPDPSETPIPGIALQAGFSVSSRNFKKATQRNRIKRLLRETFRTQKQELQSLLTTRGHHLHLFFIYTAKEMPTYELLQEKMKGALSRLLKYDQHVRR